MAQIPPAPPAAPEFQLLQPPTDGVTNVVFGNKSNYLLASSWDKGVRLYDVKKNQLRLKVEHKAAVLDCAFSGDDSKSFSGGLDQNLIMTDFKTGQKTTLGSHAGAAIKCVEYSDTTGLVVTGGWDCLVNLWDHRAQSALAGSVAQTSHKVFTMAIHENRMVVGTSGRQVYIYDVRNISQPEQVRESSLMNQTRCVQISPDGKGYALSSIEGRVSLEYFDPNPVIQKQRYAFRCHRKSVNGIQTLYPVNAIAYHPTFGTFATGGCDHVVNVWDGQNQKRICQYPSYPTSIASLAFNNDGKYLAIASSYTYEEGDRAHPADAIFIRPLNEHEVAPKKRKK